MRGDKPRRTALAVMPFLVSALVLTFGLAARAASVTPVLFTENVFCDGPTENQTDLDLDLVVKFGDDAEDAALVDGVTSGGGIDVEFDIEGGTVVSWDSGETLIGAVIVYGGSNANVYSYPGGATSDEDLVTPLNNGGNTPAISHVSFCAAPPPTEVSVSVVLGTCEFDEATEESKTPVAVTFTGEGNATVVIKDASEAVVATHTGDGSTDLLPGTYSYMVTADLGSVLATGSDVSGTLIAGECAPAVLGSGSVSLTLGECVFEDGASRTPLEVLIAPSGAATVTLTGPVSDTFTGAGGMATLLPGTYSWSATPEEGFELIGDTSGTLEAESCSAVLGGRLAKTGSPGQIGLIGAGAILLGLCVRFAARPREI